MTQPTQTRLSLPRRAARAAVFGLVWPVLSLLLSTAIFKNVSVAPSPWVLGAVFGSMAAGMVGAGAVWALSRHRQRAFAVTESELLLGDRRIPRARIEGGMIVEHAGASRIDLRLTDGELLQLAFESRAQAEAALEGLALDASRRRVSAVLNTPAETIGLTASGGLLGFLAWAPLAGISAEVMTKYGVSQSFQTVLALVTVLPLMIAGGLLVRSLTPEITIGAEGLSFRAQGWGQRRKTLRFEQLQTVALHERVGLKGIKNWSIEALLQDGSSQVLGTLGATRLAEARAITERALTALTAWQRGDASSERAAQLERSGSSIPSWIEHLRQLAQAREGYRRATLTLEQLAEIVADPRAPTQQRLGAAIMLSARKETRAAERIRVAADTSVRPKLRIALDAIAREQTDELTIQEALDEDARQDAKAQG